MNDLINKDSSEYTVIVEEVLRKDVIVSATSYFDAVDKVKKMYKDEEIVLDSSAFSETNFY